jgi:hypothetical protein
VTSGAPSVSAAERKSAASFKLDIPGGRLTIEEFGRLLNQSFDESFQGDRLIPN